MYLHLPYLVDIQRLLNIFYVFACAPGKLLCVTSKDLELDGWLRMGLFPPPPPPPREFCRHILSCRELKVESFKRCLHSVLRGVSL